MASTSTSAFKLIDDFLTYFKKKQRATNTLSSYRSDLKIFNSFLSFHSMSFREVNYETLTAFTVFLKTTQNESANTIRRMVISIRQFFVYLAQIEHIESNLIEHFKVPPRIDKLPKVFSHQEFESILSYYQGPSLKQQRDRAIVLLMGACGLKVGELCELKWSDFHTQSYQSYISVSGKNHRIIPLAPDTAETISQYKKLLPFKTSHQDNMMVSFRGNRESEIAGKISRHGVKYMISHLAKALEIEGISPQTFRHYAAICWIEEGLDDEKIAEYLGHQSLSSLEKYYEVSRRDLGSK